MAFEAQLLIDMTHAVSELKALLIAGEVSERLNLVTLETVAGILVEIEEKSAFGAVHFDFDGKTLRWLEVNK